MPWTCMAASPLRHWVDRGPVTRKLRPDLIVNVAGGELFPFGILHWQYEQKMGENLPVDAPKLGKVADSTFHRF